MNKQIKNTLVPEQYAEEFKLSIAIVNTAKALEEYTRELSSRIRLKERMITSGSATSVKKIEPISYINQLANEVTDKDKIKELNDIIDKVFVKSPGKGAVNNMAYDLQLIIKELFCLSVDDQIEVFEIIKSKYEKD